VKTEAAILAGILPEWSYHLKFTVQQCISNTGFVKGPRLLRQDTKRKATQKKNSNVTLNTREEGKGKETLKGNGEYNFEIVEGKGTVEKIMKELKTKLTNIRKKIK
jgi:hypothetical protein